MNRLIHILEAFRLDQPIVSPTKLMSELGVSRATIYRDLQQLSGSGYIERHGQGYVLGPRIFQMERQVRLADPLLHAARELSAGLARDCNGTVLLCRLHQKMVLCIHDVTSNGARSTLSYERGREAPLFRGASSMAILTQLTRSNLADLILAEPAAVKHAGLPDDVDALYERLALLRKQGFVIARGEIDEGVIEFAVPLIAGKRLLGSLAVALPEDTATPTAEARALNLLRGTRRRIEARMETAIAQSQDRSKAHLADLGEALLAV